MKKEKLRVEVFVLCETDDGSSNFLILQWYLWIQRSKNRDTICRSNRAGNAIRALANQDMQQTEVMIKGPSLGRDAVLRAIQTQIIKQKKGSKVIARNLKVCNTRAIINDQKSSGRKRRLMNIRLQLLTAVILSKDLTIGIRDCTISIQLASLAFSGRTSPAALTLASTSGRTASPMTSLEDFTHPPTTNFRSTNPRPPSPLSNTVLRRTRLEYLEKVTGVKTVGCWAAIEECREMGD
ncbi:30S ribosomal protein S11, chloroplastic, partial [Cucurbita argyrosperma subsp. argyrosperma]